MVPLRAVGLAVLLGGGVLFFQGYRTLRPYTEEKFDRAKSQPGMFGGRDDFSNWLETQERNQRNAWLAQQSAEQAAPFMKGGIAVGVVGLALLGFSFWRAPRPDSQP